MSTKLPRPARHAARNVVMVTSPGSESSLEDVALNLATVCAETGQRVALLSTAGLASPDSGPELPQIAPLWWKNWPAGATPSSRGDERHSLLAGPLRPADVEDLLGETGVPGASRLDLRYFVGHPAQVVIRVPEVVAALRQIVDVVILEVPSYLSVHHGEGLTPLADVVLVVAEREITKIEEARKTSAALGRLGAPVVGVALTNGPGLENYVWTVDSELEPADDQVGDPTTDQFPIVRPADDQMRGDTSEPLPVGEPVKDASAVPLDDGFVVEHPLPGT